MFKPMYLEQRQNGWDYSERIYKMIFSRTFSFVASVALVSFICGVMRVSAAEEAVNDASAQTRFEEFSSKGDSFTIEELLKKRKVPGVSVAVIRDYKIAWAQGYGIADVETGDVVTTDTLFQAASISKPVAAMAALRAVQDGRFDLDDKINNLLKSWQLPENELTNARAVTPRMLLSHTGGTTVHGFPGYHPDRPVPTVPQLLSGEKPSNTSAVFVNLAPTTEWRYSGGGTVIMQLALTDLYQKDFPSIVRELVLDPIGMTQSGFDQPLSPERDKTAARAHSGRAEAKDAKWHVYPELQAAGLWTTPTDLCRFGLEVMNAHRGTSTTVLTQASAQLMLTPVEHGDYGLGFSVSKKPGAIRAGHGGSNWGFKCQLEFNVDSGNGLCIMTNGDSGSAIIRECQLRLASVYGW